MNQYYNPQRYQPQTGDARQGGQPFTGAAGQQSFYPTQPPTLPSFPPAAAGSLPYVQQQPVGGQVPGMLPIEQSYIENILRLNKGKLVSVFATFEGNNTWNAKEFTGIIEAAGRDHVILSDPQTGARYLIPMVAVDYIQFSEEIEYEPTFGGTPSLGTYPPR